ncbi:hypothetical protein IF2G_06324 [Cordyceps javanica]|nr:hypothetical protein IF2G_06324 [Cordyceps javanica]
MGESALLGWQARRSREDEAQFRHRINGICSAPEPRCVILPAKLRRAGHFEVDCAPGRLVHTLRVFCKLTSD